METILFEKAVLSPIAALQAPFAGKRAHARIWHFAQSELVARVVGLFASIVALFEFFGQLYARNTQGMKNFAVLVIIGSIVGVISPGRLSGYLTSSAPCVPAPVPGPLWQDQRGEAIAIRAKPTLALVPEVSLPSSNAPLALPKSSEPESSQSDPICGNASQTHIDPDRLYSPLEEIRRSMKNGNLQGLVDESMQCPSPRPSPIASKESKLEWERIGANDSLRTVKRKFKNALKQIGSVKFESGGSHEHVRVETKKGKREYAIPRENSADLASRMNKWLKETLDTYS